MYASEMGERRGTKALETWCRRVTQGYPGVKVENMTTSWRDGLAFCALIHHFRPDLIDFARLDKSDVYGNNDLAFRIAERHLGIPALLDAEDMAEYPVPDRLSILTYLSQFYQAFASNNSSPVKKPSSESPEGSLVSLVQGNVQPPPKMEWQIRGREPCVVCKQPVFIAQRLRVEGHLYHRTCFRCARCGAQLSSADYYETCSGDYVCETCPDEMPVPEETVTVVPLPEPPLEPPPLPTVPPPSAPPEPPPSLVAMRRLMFDTDDAKLRKHDHIVNNTRIINSIKKDLSKNDDSRLCVDLIEPENKDNVNSGLVKPKDSPENLKADISANNSEALAKSVNNTTIPVCSDLSISQRMDDVGRTSPESSENKENETETMSNPEEDRPLDLSDDTPSFNASLNAVSVDKSLYADSDSNVPVSDKINTIVTSEELTVPNVTVEASNPEIVVSDTIDAINTDIVISETTDAINTDIVVSETTDVINTDIVVSETTDVSNTEVATITEATNEVIVDKSNKDKVSQNSKPKDYPDELNPFDSDDDGNEMQEKTEHKKSTNPFGSDSEDEEDEVSKVMLKPPPRIKNAFQVVRPESTNPFDSDEDEEEIHPVPKPRKSLQSSPEPTPFPRRSKQRSSGRSITSLSSIASSTSPRKKRPAPPPPTPGGLTPSSRYSSMSSLASTRSRKNRRAPLPPTFTKPPDKSNEDANKTEENQLVPELESSFQSLDSTMPSLETTGDIAHQIEEGMKKLINKDMETGDDDLHTKIKDEKDKLNDSSRLNVTIDGSEIAIKDTSKQEVPQTESPDFESDKKTEDLPSSKVEASSLTISEAFKEQNTGSDHQVSIEIEKVGSIIKEESHDSIAEAYNTGIKSISRNSSMIKYEELEPIRHSTPVKLLVTVSKNSSLEDVDSGNSYSGSFYPSPSGSCPDHSSYQESSLSSPPLEKKHKDSTNMHRKISDGGVYYPPKSSHGPWKRKKPAPPVPLPQRRIIKPMAIQRIKQELGDIEIKQQELERQGVTLEEKIREKFDSDTSITPYLEELVLQLFELVNEKNELFRKQAELMYIRRQHQLEEEHAELEFQIRCLMARPEANKTDTDKELEEKLIQRLIEVVERRDAIVQCLEMDRLREAEEDKSIHKQLDRFTQGITKCYNN